MFASGYIFLILLSQNRKFKISDIPSNASKVAPDFCTVYVISKGKISSVRNASRRAPHVSPLRDQICSNQNANLDDLIMSFKGRGFNVI